MIDFQARDDAADALRQANSAIVKGLLNPYRPLRAAFLGDSITCQNSDNTNNVYGSTAWFTIFQFLCAGKIVAAKNAGIPGDTSFGMGQRALQDALSYQPDLLFILAGRNDINSDGSVRYNTPDFLEPIIKTALDRGVTPILLNIPPTGFSASNPDANAAARANQTNTLNAGLQTLAAKYGVLFVDIHTPLSDASGLYYASTALSTDSVHPLLAGSIIIAQTAYSAVKSILPTWTSGPAMLNYIYGVSTVNDGFNPVPNGFFNASVSAVAAGGASPTFGWSPSSGSAGFTRAVINDGLCIGNWWQLSWSAGSALAYNMVTSNFSVTAFRGKRCMARCLARMSAGNSAAGTTLRLSVALLDYSGATIGGGQCYGSVDGTGQLAVEFPVPASAVSANISLYTNMPSTTLAGSAAYSEVVFREVPGVSALATLGGSVPPIPCQRVSANTTLTAADRGTIEVDASAGPVTITLPAAAKIMVGTNANYGGMIYSDGLQYDVVKIDNSANNVTIVRQGTDTINGGASTTISSQYGWAKCRATGLGRYILM